MYVIFRVTIAEIQNPTINVLINCTLPIFNKKKSAMTSTDFYVYYFNIKLKTYEKIPLLYIKHKQKDIVNTLVGYYKFLQ